MPDPWTPAAGRSQGTGGSLAAVAVGGVSRCARPVTRQQAGRPDGRKISSGRRWARGAQTPGPVTPDLMGAGCTPSLDDMAIPLALAARALRDAMKDKSYQATPVGVMVGRYVRWLRNEYGATRSTIRDYEAILARMALTLADRTPADVDTEDLRDVIDLWAERSDRTRQKVTSVVRAFWDWMEVQGHIAISPAARIRRPRAARRIARVLPADSRPRLLEAAGTPRDRLGLYCLLTLGLRRAELAGIQARHFDPARGAVRVFGKGRKERLLPMPAVMIGELSLYLLADPPHLQRPPEPDDYLLYPVRRLAAGKGSEGQMRYRMVPAPKTHPSPQAIHRWWYRLAQDAGLVGRGETQGLNMHQARHLFAIELRRVAGIDAASQALGHADLSTTLGIYGHRDTSDLERAMRQYSDWLDSEQ